MTKPNGVVLWEGPSRFTGAPVVAIVTGIGTFGSLNPKTGPMAQVWILRRDIPPMDAKRENSDDAVCGDCILRGEDGFNSGCYVTVWQAPHQVWKTYRADKYPRVDAAAVRSAMAGHHVRLSAYGDPAAVPTSVWMNLLTSVLGWVGYTHQWKIADPELRWLCMASVESMSDAAAAHTLGWRTFRARGPRELLTSWTDRREGMPGAEVVCPASDEAGHRVTCEDCQLCRGRSRPARSISIVAHGKPGQRANFYRNQAALEQRRGLHA